MDGRRIPGHERARVRASFRRQGREGRVRAFGGSARGQAHLSEICYGSFAREFSLPESVDSEHVQASLKDGVLTLHLPKKPESQPRKIAVKAS
jgi:HSP20 family molecular chaperone IbpA